MNILEHLNIFNRIMCKLESIEVKIKDEDKSLISLTLLPLLYEFFITTLLYVKDII